jgi:hypothetical protein
MISFYTIQGKVTPGSRGGNSPVLAKIHLSLPLPLPYYFTTPKILYLVRAMGSEGRKNRSEKA